MAARYTDVDLMLLKRWDEVAALREAFDQLIGRMSGIIEVAFQRTATALAEKGFQTEFELKRPSLSVWKREWETRRKDAALYGIIADFVPEDFGRSVEAHPTLWLVTEDFGSLRMTESPEDFGRALRVAISEEQRARWNHPDLQLHRTPLGREFSDVSESDRVSLVSDPDALTRFLTARVDEFLELVPAIDATLAQMTRR